MLLEHNLDIFKINWKINLRKLKGIFFKKERKSETQGLNSEYL